MVTILEPWSAATLHVFQPVAPPLWPKGRASMRVRALRALGWVVVYTAVVSVPALKHY